MYQKFNDKIQGLQSEISQIDERLQANSQDIEQQKFNVEQLESDLLKYRKLYALDNSLENRKLCADTQKEVTKAKTDFDDYQILAEALADKKTGLESELKSTIDDLRLAQSNQMISKAQGLVIAYDQAIRQAYKMSQYLQTLSKELRERKHFDILKAACPAAADLHFLPAVVLTTTRIDPVNQRPLEPPYTTNCIEVCKCEQYDHKQIIEELIS